MNQNDYFQGNTLKFFSGGVQHLSLPCQHTILPCLIACHNLSRHVMLTDLCTDFLLGKQPVIFFPGNMRPVLWQSVYFVRYISKDLCVK